MKNELKNRILNSLIFIFIFNFIVGIVYLSNYYYKLHTNEAVYEDIKDTATKNENKNIEEAGNNPSENIDFNGLKKINEDIYGWIRIPNTGIDYPILQHPKDDTYYLNRNINGSQGYPGCIYSEKYNKKDFTDFITVLYGHNMRDGTMFGALHQYENINFFNENPYIYIYTPKQSLVYKIIIASEYDNKHILKNFDFTEEKGKDLFIKSVLNMNNKNVREELEADLNNPILVLSTCSNTNSSNRYVVIAKKNE